MPGSPSSRTASTPGPSVADNTSWDEIVDELPDRWTLKIEPYTVVGTNIRSARVWVTDDKDVQLVYKKLPVGELDELLGALLVIP